MAQTEPRGSATENLEIPLFYVGSDPGFQPLARGLGTRRAFYRLDIDASVMRQVKNPYSLRCIAEHCARAIRETRARGPYMLGGWCAHGVLALETAQMLREQGQDVALVVLLEAINPERLREQTRLGHYMGALQTKMNLLTLKREYFRSTGREPAKNAKLTGLQKGLRRTSGRRKVKETAWTRSTPTEILYAAMGNYLPRPYDSPVLLVRSRRSIFGMGRDMQLGWSKTLGEKLEVCETDGNHYTMHVGRNVQELVQKVSERLKQAEQRWQQRRRKARHIA